MDRLVSQLKGVVFGMSCAALTRNVVVHFLYLLKNSLCVRLDDEDYVITILNYICMQYKAI